MFQDIVRVRHLSRWNHMWWKPYISLTPINSRTDVKPTPNFTLRDAVSCLSKHVDYVEVNGVLVFLGFYWQIYNSKVMKQSSNYSCGHCCWWTKPSFCNFRLAVFSIWVISIEGDWCKRRKGSQCFWCQRKSFRFNLLENSDNDSSSSRNSFTFHFI